MLERLEISGFKSFNQKSVLDFDSPVCAVVGPNGSGKSNVVEALRFALGEQSIKSLRGRKGEDLIFNGSLYTPKSNTAKVKVVFKNSEGKMDIDFDEVEIERVVYRDGVNQYLINKSPARLKDVLELLASVNIGSSSYHIISQGEADRFLKASPQDRRSMIEESLGLTSYKFKKKESEIKLRKTYENIGQIESKKREIAPNLKYLKKEVEKSRKQREAREKLSEIYGVYLKIESEYISFWEKQIEESIEKLDREIENIQKEINILKENVSNSGESQKERELKEKIEKAKKEISELSSQKNELSRGIGKIEGELSFLKEKDTKKESSVEEKKIPASFVRSFAENVLKETFLEDSDIEKIKKRIKNIKESAEEFLNELDSKDEKNLTNKEVSSNGIEKEFLKKLEDFESEIEEIEKKESESKEEISALESALYEKERGKVEEREKVYKLRSKKKDLDYERSAKEEERRKINYERERLREDLKEAAFKIGRGVLSFESSEIFDEAGRKMEADEIVNESREKQRERKREIERYKFRLEDEGLSVSSSNVEREYEETKKEDEFLTKELSDLNNSAQKLDILIKDLERRLNLDFNSGIEKINSEFQNFFSLLFGGGEGRLYLSRKKKKVSEENETQNGNDLEDDTEDEQNEGVEISVSLPRKKIKGLEMLSGGERTLTSAALIFALSQVNPPPFLILDEIDASLDEVNSRRFGDMLQDLSKKSQLVMVSHNRETMGRAGALYGVTMSGDGVSKLLSVKFDEAVEMAGN